MNTMKEGEVPDPKIMVPVYSEGLEFRDEVIKKEEIANRIKYWKELYKVAKRRGDKYLQGYFEGKLESLKIAKSILRELGRYRIEYLIKKGI